ncbi:hypothetical protein [Lonepinella sp. MS14437]|uniref:hypothetical protein n=1 Tax=Lonepinella sp. MS14437 TaxID=3003620 RepID=UPI0036DB66C2
MDNQYVLIKFKGKSHSVPLSDFELNSVSSNERGMGAETGYEFSYCGDLDIELNRQIYEYPVGCFNHKLDWQTSPNVEIIDDKINYESFFIPNDEYDK